MSQPDTGIGAQAVACWAALLRVGVPPDEWIARRVWDNALRIASGVESTQALRYRTKTAKDYGLVHIDPGQRGQEGRAKLTHPDDPNIFIPHDFDLPALPPSDDAQTPG
jgi:hypothetical protein